MKSAKDRLREAGKHLKLTQEKFGKPIGVSQANIRDPESGKVKISASHALALQNVFDISSVRLLKGEGEMFLKEELMKSELSEALNSHPGIKNIILMPGQTEDKDIKNIEGMPEKEQKMKCPEKEIHELKKVIG